MRHHRVIASGPWVCVGFAVVFHIANWFSTPRVMAAFDAEFNTPQLKNISELARFIELQTPHDVLIAAAPFDVDVLGPLTSRKGLFIYADYVPNRDANGSSRLAWYNEKKQHIETLLLSKDLRSNCNARELFAPFTRPVLFIMKVQSDALKQAAEEAQGSEICRGLKYVGQLDERLVFLGGE